MSNLFSIIADKLYFTLRVSWLLTSLNDASVDIVDDEGSFEVFPKAKFTSPMNVYITLATDTEEESLLTNAVKIYWNS